MPPIRQAASANSRQQRRVAAYSPEPFQQALTSQQRRRQAQQRRRAQERSQQALSTAPIYEAPQRQWAANEAAARRHARNRPYIIGDVLPVASARLPWARQPLLPHGNHRHYLGPMSSVCPCCQALHFACEASEQQPVGTFTPFRACCKFGRVDLQPLPQPPPLLHGLLTKSGRGMLLQ